MGAIPRKIAHVWCRDIDWWASLHTFIWHLVKKERLLSVTAHSCHDNKRSTNWLEHLLKKNVMAGKSEIACGFDQCHPYMITQAPYCCKCTLYLTHSIVVEEFQSSCLKVTTLPDAWIDRACVIISKTSKTTSHLLSTSLWAVFCSHLYFVAFANPLFLLYTI